MKFKNITFLIILAVLTSCERDENKLELNPNTAIDAQITRIDSENDFSSSIQFLELVSKDSDWYEWEPGIFTLIFEITFNLYLENGEQLELGIWFKKDEDNPSILELSEMGKDRDWRYKRIEDEIINFYQNYDYARVLVDNTVIFYEPNTNSFKIEKAKTAMVDSKEVIYLEINFEGEAYGWYDPFGNSMHHYKIEEGVFRGVIK